MLLYIEPHLIIGQTLFPLIFVAIYYIIALFLGLWVYHDAKKRGLNERVWLVIVLCTGCIGFIIYLIDRE